MIRVEVVNSSVHKLASSLWPFCIYPGRHVSLSFRSPKLSLRRRVVSTQPHPRRSLPRPSCNTFDVQQEIMTDRVIARHKTKEGR
jgi:hypothetical protein